ncbi:DNA cytosine methyltransferase [Gloeobacter morelensis]|uniref:Cytosine-specific methyltransferase n=1 Tax=Gloeobacter morelensis MG652769 TaxID=2781736 RepID=A0ABY3PG38_9CYAN|nr:DNA cytosine methyltransferase [Gloeobacter morelensis]UFP92609.1 DNA cytosine methyltransferase [Gloeobacter morelensis MG652769]
MVNELFVSGASEAPPAVIDLFCGCGGFSSGLLDAGLAVRAGFDQDRHCLEAYNYNHNYRGATSFRVDLSRVSGVELLEIATLQSVDLVVGGPPCQAFSIAGHRRGLADRRGLLLFDFERLVGELAPSAFILENVPNLQNVENGFVLARLLTGLRALGYQVECAVLAASDYGVPQLRKRLFIVGLRGGTLRRFPPTPTHADPAQLFARAGLVAPYRTVSDALDDLPDVTTLQAQQIFNHEPTFHSEGMLAAFARLAPGERCPRSFQDRLHPHRPGYTLRAGHGNFTPLRPVHHRYDRVISVRESARLQGFADTFIWPDTIARLQQYRQVGNAVCPPVAASLGRWVGGAMGWKLDPGRFIGEPGYRAPALTHSFEQRQAAQCRRIRGASRGGAQVSLDKP